VVLRYDIPLYIKQAYFDIWYSSLVIIVKYETLVCTAVGLQSHSYRRTITGNPGTLTATTHCNNTLRQRTATTHCNSILQHHTAFTLCNDTLQHTATTHCNTRQHTAPTRCNTLLQHTAIQPYDYKADIWALGVLIYHISALKGPFAGDNIYALGTYLYIDTCIHIYIYTWVRMYICIFMNTFMNIYIYVFVYMCIHIHTSKWRKNLVYVWGIHAYTYA